MGAVETARRRGTAVATEEARAEAVRELTEFLTAGLRKCLAEDPGLTVGRAKETVEAVLSLKFGVAEILKIIVDPDSPSRFICTYRMPRRFFDALERGNLTALFDGNQ